MKYSVLASAVVAFAVTHVANALPAKRDITGTSSRSSNVTLLNSPIDPQVLNYALTLGESFFLLLNLSLYADYTCRASRGRVLQRIARKVLRRRLHQSGIPSMDARPIPPDSRPRGYAR